MILSELAKKWGSGLWKLFRPTELLSGIIDGYRVALNSLTWVDNNLSGGELPVARGTGYEVLTIPLKNIRHTTLVAGREAVDTSLYPYMVLGAPSGIIYFCRSLSAVGGSSRYAFVEIGGVYYFKDNPTKFGVINARDGGYCSFIVFNAKSKSLGIQDTLSKFGGSVDHFINCTIAEHEASSGISNGSNIRLYYAAAGADIAGSEDIEKVWVEGGNSFALTSSGRLLRNYGEKSLDNGPADKGVVYCNAETEELTFSADTAVTDAQSAHGVVSIDTTSGPDCAESQRAIDLRLNPVSTVVLYQKMQITPPPEATGIYVYYADTEDGVGCPLVCAGMKPRHAVLDNCDRFGVLRLSIDSESTPTAAVSDNGIFYGQPLRCGKYIKALSYIKAGKCLADDVILSHVQVDPVLVNAGGCVVFVKQ